MARTFYRKKFSNYLGEQRAIDDIVLSFTADIGPSPTPTPSITPSPTTTPAVTSTPTPSVTSTLTQTPTTTPTNTPTNTGTPTQTPTNTATPTFTPTPTKTPNALCPQQLILSASSPSYLYGLYNRATINTGGTFETAWYNFDDNIMNYGTNPDGNDYVAFSINSGSDYTSLYWSSDIFGNDGNWTIGYSTGNTLFNGGTLISSIILDTDSLVSGSLFFPPNGFLQFNGGYINYPASCPTPTPTPSSTATPTLTPTPSAVAFDADAASFLSAVLTAGGTGITSTVSAATNTLYVSLKSNGLYNNLYFYPMIGGVANSVALFGKRTSGTTYDISWSGNPLTFTSSGATGNGSGYGNTNLSRAIYSNLGDFSFGCYISGNDAAAFGYELGTAGGTDRNLLIVRYINSDAFVGTGNGFKTGNNPGALGMYIATQTGTTGTVKLIKNGSTTLINTTNSDNQFDGNIQWVLRGQEFSVRTMSFAVFSRYYTDAQVQTLSNIINTFQTSLGRNTY